jgi:hypothetical protein
MRFFIVAVLLALLMGTAASGSAHAAAPPTASAATEGFVPPVVRQLAETLIRRSPRAIKPAVKHGLELAREDAENDARPQQRDAITRLRRIVIAAYCNGWVEYYGNRSAWQRAASVPGAPRAAWVYCARYQLLRSATADAAVASGGHAWLVKWLLRQAGRMVGNHTKQVVIDRAAEWSRLQAIRWYCHSWWRYYGYDTDAWQQAAYYYAGPAWAWNFCAARGMV